MVLVDRELDRYQVDMAALSEPRLADVGEAADAHYTFFWSDKAPNYGAIFYNLCGQFCPYDTASTCYVVLYVR